MGVGGSLGTSAYFCCEPKISSKIKSIVKKNTIEGIENSLNWGKGRVDF